MATDAITDLLETVLRTQDVEEAASIVVERLGAHAGSERAVLLLDSAPGVHGAARHLSYGSMQGIRNALEETLPLFQALLHETDWPATLAPQEITGIEIERALALPCRHADGRPFGVLILDGDALPDPAPVQDLLDRISPALDLRRAADSTARAVDRLSGQRDLQQRLFDALSDAVVITDSNNDIVLANRRAEQLFTTTPSDSEGRARAIQINNLLFSSFLTQGVISGPGNGGRELNLVDTEEGSDLLLEVITLPLEEAIDGRTISVLRDITDLKRALTELEVQNRRSRAAEYEARQERDRVNTILENVGEPILVTDDQANIVLANPEAERLFMPPREGTESRRRLNSRSANDTRMMAHISKFLLRDEQRATDQLEIADPDTEREFPVEVVASKILNVRGEPIAVVTILHDLTQAHENERLAKALQQLNEQLEERIRQATRELEERNRQLQWQSAELLKASQLKTEFLANMSHELRTPINVVLGYTSLMKEEIYGELNSSQVDALERIHATSQHLLELISDILDLSKIEAGMMPVNASEVDVRLLVGELSTTIAPILERNHLELRIDLAPDLPVIWTDQVKLKQVLLNLLSNAIKFTPEGMVSIRGTAVGDAIRMEIEDTGIGIPEGSLQEIFEAFRQIDQSHTREFGGTGLGLSITRKLLDLLGGSVRVRSELGVGTCFTIDLPPLAEADPDVDGGVSTAAPASVPDPDRTPAAQESSRPPAR